MKNNIRRNCCTGLLSFVSLSSFAQGVRTAYFLDSFHYRHQLNPALSGDQNYFSLPGIGSLNIGFNGNVGLSDFLYPVKDIKGKEILTTFMSRYVDSSDFLDGLAEKTRIRNSVDLTVFSTGFKSWGGFSTIDIGLHSRTSINLPYELFEFMKVGDYGIERNVYNLRDIGASTNNYMDISLGHSHQINDRLQVGASIKALFGLGRIDITFDEMNVQMSEDQWLIDANGEINSSFKGLEYTTNKQLEVDGFNFIPDKIGLSGVGVAVDLGATYEVIDNLLFSASIIDLGFINWNTTNSAKTNNQPYLFRGFDQIGVGADSPFPSIEEQFETLGDDLEDLIKVYDRGEKERSTMLGATVNVGLEYVLPVYNKFSIGLLSTTYLNKPFTWTEGRLSANISPVRWFEASVSGVYSNFGSGMGFLLNLHPKGFSLFMGADFSFGEVTPQFMPVDHSNVSLVTGINFPLNL